MFTAHSGAISMLTELPDGRLLSGSDDGTLALWPANFDQPDARLVGHEDYLNGATPLDDHRVVSWSEDGTLRIWAVPSGEPLAVYSFDDAQDVAPEVYAAWKRATEPRSVWGQTRVQASDRFEPGNHGGAGDACRLWVAGHHFVRWDTERYAEGEVVQVLPDGTVIVRCNRRLEALQLYRGAERISFASAEAAISTAPPGTLPQPA
jgi:hypothetical protein